MSENETPSSAESGDDAPDEKANRRFPRLNRACAIRVRPLAGVQPPTKVASAAGGAEAITVNISGGGVRYRTDEALESGTFAAVELSLPGHETPVIALGRSVHCSGEGPFEVGMEFWWVGWGDESAQQAISEFIRTELSTRSGE